MFTRILIVNTVFLLANLSFADTVIPDQIEKEMFYNSVLEMILNDMRPSHRLFLDVESQKLTLDALEALLVSDDLTSYEVNSIYNFLNALPPSQFTSSIQYIRVLRLKRDYLNENIQLNPQELLTRLNTSQGYYEYYMFFRKNPKELELLERKTPELYKTLTRVTVPFEQLTQSELQDLLSFTALPVEWKLDASIRSQIFMFCRHKRKYPCLMMVKDIAGQFIMSEDGKTPWTQPSLGYAVGGTPYYQRNGYTPSGVYTIDGVMPYADKPTSFGKFRRLILDFIPQTENEALYLEALPSSHANKKWWRESVLARDIGRDLLRIHGTGRKNSSGLFSPPYKPFHPTLGCVAQREGPYKKVDYIDQRHLLDQLMKAQGLEPNYDNEIKIKSTLVLVEIDNKKGPVKYQDLLDLGLIQ